MELQSAQHHCAGVTQILQSGEEIGMGSGYVQREGAGDCPNTQTVLANFVYDQNATHITSSSNTLKLSSLMFVNNSFL